jgi:hypothetical protein
MSDTYCDEHKTKKIPIFGNIMFCPRCDEEPKEARKLNEDGFHIPPAPTYKEEHFYYSVLQLKKNWAKSPQFARIFEDMAAAQIELRIRKDAKLGVTFKIGKIVTAIACDAWLPTGMSSPTYAVWNGEENTPPKTNGRHATLTEWVRSTGFNSRSAQTGRMASAAKRQPPRVGSIKARGKAKPKGKLSSKKSKP